MKERLPTRAVLCLLALAVVACDEPSQERFVDLVVPVTVLEVAPRTMESTVAATGSLRAVRRAQILTEIEGTIYFLPGPDGERLAEGSHVEAGQEVARLENEEWLVGLRLESRQLAVDNAEKNLDDRQALYEEGLGLQADVDNARRALADAVADQENARLQLRKQKVRAPIEGTLTEITTVTESVKVPAGTVVATVVDYADVLLDLQIPASQVGEVRRGQEVRVTSYAVPDRVFTGRIDTMDPALDPATRTVRVVARIDNEELLLRPGMFVSAMVVTESRPGVLAIPREIVMRRQNNDVVFVEENGQADMRQVEIGLEQEGWVEVLSGLEKGDRVITSNFETLRSRTQVRVTGEDTAGAS